MSDRDYVKQQIHILQEKERLDNKYTYFFYLRSLNGRVGGLGSNHNNFSFEVPAIPEMNIKDCVCRVKHLVLPKGSAIVNANIGLDCNFLKPKIFDSQFSAMTNQSLGLFNIQKQLAEFSSQTQITATTFKKIRANGQIVSGNGTAIVGADTKSVIKDDGTIGDEGAGGFDSDIVGGFIKNPVMSAIPIPRHLGFTADPINKEFQECQNPFGKKINFKVKNKNGVDLQDCGISNDEGVYVVLELKLLPNPVEIIQNNY